MVGKLVDFDAVLAALLVATDELDKNECDERALSVGLGSVLVKAGYDEVQAIAAARLVAQGISGDNTFQNEYARSVHSATRVMVLYAAVKNCMDKIEEGINEDYLHAIATALASGEA